MPGFDVYILKFQSFFFGDRAPTLAPTRWPSRGRCAVLWFCIGFGTSGHSACITKIVTRKTEYLTNVPEILNDAGAQRIQVDVGGNSIR